MPLRVMPSGLEDHIKNNKVTTLANCWRITRYDGVVFRFVDCDVEVELGDGIYTPANSGSASAVENTVEPSADNLTITQILDSEHITVDDLNAGLFDGAKVEIYLVNYKDPGQGTATIFIGYFGEVTFRDDIDFEVELKSISTKLKQTIGRQYTQQCDADLADSRCGIKIAEQFWSGETLYSDGEILEPTYRTGYLYEVLSGGTACSEEPDWPVTIGETVVDCNGVEYECLQENFAYSGEIDSVISKSKLKDSSRTESEDWFQYGTFEFTSGLNKGQIYEIKGFSGNLPIYSVDTNKNIFGIYGNELNEFDVGDVFDVVNSTGNDGTYTVSSIEYDDLFGYLEYDGEKYDVYKVGEYSFTTLGLSLKDAIDQKKEDNDDFELEGESFQITDSEGYDGGYQMRSVSDEDGNTKVTTMNRVGFPHNVGVTYITTEENISSSVADGEISYAQDGIFDLWISPPFRVEVGDKYKAIAGCSKYLTTCKNKFNNVVNFRGFPHIPGRDEVSKYPDSNR